LWGTSFPFGHIEVQIAVEGGALAGMRTHFSYNSKMVLEKVLKLSMLVLLKKRLNLVSKTM
jgi:hypothetical protein